MYAGAGDSEFTCDFIEGRNSIILFSGFGGSNISKKRSGRKSADLRDITSINSLFPRDLNYNFIWVNLSVISILYELHSCNHILSQILYAAFTYEWFSRYACNKLNIQSLYNI